MDVKRYSRRAVVAGLLGIGALVAAEPIGRAVTRWNDVAAAAKPASTFPAWVRTTPHSLKAYEAAFAQPDLMATLPCFCGCDRMDLQHTSLRDCFMQADGRLERHGAVCGTCQGEALDAAALAKQGVPWAEIRTRIVAAYGPSGPPARQHPS